MTFSLDFNFGSSFDFQYHHEWISKYWQYSFAIAAVYIASIFLGQALMKKRAKFELQKLLFLWNLILAVFSICGVFGTTPELLNGLAKYDFRFTVCDNSYLTVHPYAIWNWLFLMSKVVELGDTIFIVLRKSPLIFLHWFHHATVLLYCFYTYYDASATGRWFVVMNFSVHAFMYSYFALKAISVRIPRTISMLLTITQLSQMVVGCSINYSAYHFKMADQNGCAVSFSNILFSFLMYLIYFLLFVWFFMNSYIVKSRSLIQK